MADAVTLLGLAERVEGATADEQWSLLREAADLLLGGGDFGKRATFSRFLQAGAYESAAMLLVPEGWRIVQLGEWKHSELRRPGPWFAVLARDEPREAPHRLERCTNAQSAALALTSASLRALAAIKEEGGR